MTLHVIGAGLAGLSCALAAADAGLEVVVHEAAKQAGGRCRSWDDPLIGRRIDNGTHVVVGGNRAARGFLRRIGAEDSLMPLPRRPSVLDLDTGKVWRAGPIELTRAYLGSLWRFAFDDRGTAKERLDGIAFYRTLWEPLVIGALNTDAERASAALFRAVLAGAIWRGLGASRMHMVRESLAESFVVPALAALAARGAEVRFGHGLREPVLKKGRVAELVFDDASVVLSRHNAAVLAVPWWIAGRWLGLPELPDSPIVNGHFRLASPPDRLANHNLLGLVGGTGQWIFRRDDVLSIHASAAGGLDEIEADELTRRLWSDIQKALGISGEPAAGRAIKERRATLLHTPETESLRPHRRQGENLWLAGDWTATGLPCTIEGAIRSGNAAAADAVALLRDKRK